MQTAVHATLHRGWPLAVAGLLLGLVVEHASLRLGGTHCHASSPLLNVSDCSSANSVFYYMPWVYSCVTAARRLVPVRSWCFPPLCGMLFFGMCGVYESQGPLMGWWLWPRADGVVKPGCDIWQHGVPGEDTRGLAVSAHAAAALAGRNFGVPALAPFFHFAFGWGIGLALQLFGVLADERLAELNGGDGAYTGVDKDRVEEVGVDRVEDAREGDQIDRGCH